MTTRGGLFLAAMVAAVVAVAVLLLLPAGAPGGQAELQADTARHTVRMVVDKVVVGTSAVQIEVSEAADVTGVRLEPVMTHMGHAFPPLTAEPVTDSAERGRYRTDVGFDMPGHWELTVVIDDGQGTQRVTFPITVTG